VFEVQIRTADMHRAAEEGSAAHWRYRSPQPIRASIASRLLGR
jgi:(p)ppGpp synthase/HD superfamily hydrolase